MEFYSSICRLKFRATAESLSWLNYNRRSESISNISRRCDKITRVSLQRIKRAGIYARTNVSTLLKPSVIDRKSRRTEFKLTFKVEERILEILAAYVTAYAENDIAGRKLVPENSSKQRRKRGVSSGTFSSKIPRVFLSCYLWSKLARATTKISLVFQ